ncbi:hypothetical protein [Streptomyces longwoodensis]|uniref:hypothetical protein n=1 Tax=Streptomyces longwoodensis TaxID=68231 RepID=UPI003401A3D9
MPETDPKQRLVERFQEVNGDHPMTDADDVYVSAQFVALEELCAVHGREADAVRRLMLSTRHRRSAGIPGAADAGSDHGAEPASGSCTAPPIAAVR